MLVQTPFEDSDLASVLGITAQTGGKPSRDPNSGAILVGVNTLDDRYYTESEVDASLSGKSDVGHTHDDRYFTEAEINAALAGKADKATTLAGYGITDALALSGGTLTGQLNGTSAAFSGAVLAGGATNDSPNAKLFVAGDAKISGTYPSYVIKPAAWSAGFYFQSGVNAPALSTGNYTAFVNPVDKGFAWVQGNPLTTGRYCIVVSDATGNVSVGKGTDDGVNKLQVNGSLALNGVGANRWSTVSAGTSKWETDYAGVFTFSQLQSGQLMSVQLQTAEGKLAGLKHYDTASYGGRLLELWSQPGVPIRITPAGVQSVQFSTDGSAAFSASVSLGPYIFATLPSASANAGKVLRITDRGQKLAYSDGAGWLFVHDNSVVV
ncbi:MAG: hypothetical protein ACTHK7_08160 [Aureliella sp.]